MSIDRLTEEQLAEMRRRDAALGDFKYDWPMVAAGDRRALLAELQATREELGRISDLYAGHMNRCDRIRWADRPHPEL